MKFFAVTETKVILVCLPVGVPLF